jgi:hypothetical protein
MRGPRSKEGSVVINLEVETRLSLHDAVKEIKSYFGEGGLGLKLEQDDPGCLHFEGSGGFVNAVICSSKGKTKIELHSKEWDQQVKAFAGKIS